jgi:putative membrane protein
MIIVANVLVALMAVLHVYILYLEMFRWTSPKSLRSFGTTAEFAEQTRTLAANQGLYNGFLAAGLIWGLIASDPTGFAAKAFFLVCIAVAGVYGAVTSSRRILFVQTVPAVLALVVVVAAR